MPRVLLIAPPWGHIYGNFKSLSRRLNFNPPLGLCYLAAALAEKGYDTKIVDAEAQGLDTAAIINMVRNSQWDVVGLSATTPLFPAAAELATAIKAVYGGPIVLGGPHATIVGKEALFQASGIDFLVCGEGESTFPQLVESLKTGKGLESVKGIVRRDGSEVVFSGAAKRERNLDRFGFPDRTQLNPLNYLWSVPGKGLVPTTSVMFTRGCPFECTFCSQKLMYGRDVRRRSVENMLAEFEQLLSDTPYRHFVFLDDTLTYDREHLTALLNGIIERGYRFTFEGETRASLLDRELVALMREAGLVRMNIGIESGDPDMLKRLKTGITLDDVRTSLRLLKSYRIETRGTVVIGAPYECRETVMRTLDFVINLQDLDQPYICIAAPYPGTLMREQALRGEGGSRLLNDDYGSLLRYGYSSMVVNDLTADQLVKLQAWGLRRAYLQPKRFIYNLRRAGFRAGIVNGYAFARSLLSSNHFLFSRNRNQA